MLVQIQTKRNIGEEVFATKYRGELMYGWTWRPTKKDTKRATIIKIRIKTEIPQAPDDNAEDGHYCQPLDGSAPYWAAHISDTEPEHETHLKQE